MLQLPSAPRVGIRSRQFLCTKLRNETVVLGQEYAGKCRRTGQLAAPLIPYAIASRHEHDTDRITAPPSHLTNSSVCRGRREAKRKKIRDWLRIEDKELRAAFGYILDAADNKVGSNGRFDPAATRERPALFLPVLPRHGVASIASAKLRSWAGLTATNACTRLQVQAQTGSEDSANSYNF
jgi:hypothetical protein